MRLKHIVKGHKKDEKWLVFDKIEDLFL